MSPVTTNRQQCRRQQELLERKPVYWNKLLSPETSFLFGGSGGILETATLDILS
jgi:hypothetical protein